MTTLELYQELAPPIELIDHLERFEQRQALPAPVVTYLEKWRTIRSDQPLALPGAQMETPAKERAAA